MALTNARSGVDRPTDRAGSPNRPDRGLDAAVDCRSGSLPRTPGREHDRSRTVWLIVASLTLLPSPGWSGELLIDDFEDRNLISRQGLAWMVIADDMMGGGSRGRLEIATDGSSAALKPAGERRVPSGFPCLRGPEAY